VYHSSHSALLLIFLPLLSIPMSFNNFSSPSKRVGAAPRGRNTRAHTSLQGSDSAPGELGQDEADAPPLPSMEQPLTSLGSRLSHRLQRRLVRSKSFRLLTTARSSCKREQPASTLRRAPFR
jgi:hypothetical protein